jgi:putrescine aminotransferase
MSMTMQTSKQVFDAYVERSWRSLAERQRAKNMEFVIGKREGCHIWNLEGTRRVLDCGNSGGVHSLGHRNPEIVAALHEALDLGLDAGLWAMPSAELLAAQDALAAVAPVSTINRSVLTCTATQSNDLALMFSFRVTGRKKAVAYRYGYHGHGGWAALVTGSQDEGVLEHYSLPTDRTRFFGRYGDLSAIEPLIDEGCAAVILEAFDYETFQPAPPGFLIQLEALCRSRGALLIIDETRTGLSRSGRFWMSSHSGVSPDILILGKGLGGGIYPVSALLATERVYDICMNASGWGYQSSMGGNPLGAFIASRVIELSQRPELFTNIARIEAQLEAGFAALTENYPDIYRMTAVLGGIATLGLQQPPHGRLMAPELFRRGVFIHSVSLVEPLVVKFFPCLTSDPTAIGELLSALDDFATCARRGAL